MNDLGTMSGQLPFLVLGKAADDDEIPRIDQMRRRTVDADRTSARFTRNRIRDQAVAVVDIEDVNLLVFDDVGGPHQVGVDGHASLVMQLRIGDGRSMNLGLEQSSLHS